MKSWMKVLESGFNYFTRWNVLFNSGNKSYGGRYKVICGDKLFSAV